MPQRSPRGAPPNIQFGFAALRNILRNIRVAGRILNLSYEKPAYLCQLMPRLGIEAMTARRSTDRLRQGLD